MMVGYLAKHRWVNLVLNLLAIPTGLSLMWFGRKWYLFVSKNTQDLPDTGGHWLEFLAFDLSGILVFIFGFGILAASVYTLMATRCFKYHIDDLSPRDRSILLMVTIVGIGFVTLAIAVGGFLLLQAFL
jgi:hypothetical protein